MLFAWSSAELRQLCATTAALTQALPHGAASATDLLGAVQHAPTLRLLARLRCLSIRLSDHIPSSGVAALIRLEEVEMRALVLTKKGEPIRAGQESGLWVAAGSAEALLVEDFSAAGQSLVRVAS